MTTRKQPQRHSALRPNPGHSKHTPPAIHSNPLRHAGQHLVHTIPIPNSPVVGSSPAAYRWIIKIKQEERNIIFNWTIQWVARCLTELDLEYNEERQQQREEDDAPRVVESATLWLVHRVLWNMDCNYNAPVPILLLARWLVGPQRRPRRGLLRVLCAG